MLPVAAALAIAAADLSGLSKAEVERIWLPYAIWLLVATAWLTLPGFDQSQALRTVVEGGHRQLHPHHLAVTRQLVEEAHAVGVHVTTWTVDDPARIRELAEQAVDGVITNAPDVALAALGRDL